MECELRMRLNNIRKKYNLISCVGIEERGKLKLELVSDIKRNCSEIDLVMDDLHKLFNLSNDYEINFKYVQAC
ncbi:hypothetical protein HN587_00730 [Candidatus Woesearchaeota archaeon]|jgi:hypothetical protein|nr:hypothetical protein [Candidatus Woesearchaeota archaeon]